MQSIVARLARLVALPLASSASVIVDAGIGYIIARTVQLDVSAGTGAHGDTPPRPFVALGVSVRADPFHHPSH